MRNKTIVAAILSAVVGISLPLSVLADETVLDNSVTNPEDVDLVESGTIEVEASQVRLIIGGSKGAGVLHFEGNDYKFKFSGASVGGVGVTSVKAFCTVYNLNDIKDFPGNYSGGGVGAVAVKGAGASTWENAKKVVINCKAESADGLALNLGLNAVAVELVK